MFDVFYFGKTPNVFPHEFRVSSIDEAREKSRTRYFWILNYLSDYSGFDFLWEPVSWESEYIHTWPSQWQKDGGTHLVPKRKDSGTKYHDFVVPRNASSANIYVIDHYDNNINSCINSIDASSVDTTITRYSSNYLNTIRRIARKVSGEHEYIWICSSVCDYSNFDFSWHPELWQNKMIHVFSSNEQKFGDTFFIHVPSLLEQTDIELLDWHNINFVSYISVPRWKYPEIIHNDDSHVDSIKQQELVSPLTLFSCRNSNAPSIPTIPLWDEKKKTITPLSSGGSSVIIPRESVATIDRQLYDYPHIDKRFINQMSDPPLDIIFISNGETNAEENWNYLLETTADKPNRVARIDGVNGRVAAYQAALEESNTDWAFCVFAKLKVNPEFDWGWQPDRMQQRKHYIFHAKNPVNGLEYGHMAMIAYNKKLTLQNTGCGLDFTLDQEHDVVPLLSGTAEFNNDPWMTWRTAFRECLKLRDSLPNIENEYRLETWLSVGDGNNAEWSVRGAEDAVKYYESVNGDFEELKLSYEWKWLQGFFNREYSQ